MNLINKIILPIVIILMLFYSCFTNKKNQTAPIAKEGVLDLSEWDFNKNGAVKLDGEWEFYWNQIIKPAEFYSEENQYTKTLFKLPQLWNGFVIQNKEISGEGFATYRLFIKTGNEKRALYAFKFDRIETAYKLFVNNKLIFTSGNVGNSALNSSPRWYPTEITFETIAKVQEIVIQISNFYHKKGGIAKSISFGLPDQIKDLTDKKLGIDIFLLGVLLIMGFYHFGLFFLRKTEKTSLYFSFVCFFTAIYMMANGEILFVRLFKNINWELLVKTNYISNILRILFFTLFIGKLFKDEIHQSIIKFTVVFSIIYSAFIIITPAKIYTHTLILLISVAFPTVLYLIYGLIKATLKKKEGALLSFIGSIILFLATINDVLYDYNIIQTMYLIHYAVFLFIFFQAYMLSFRSARLFSSVENLTQRLILLDTIKNQFLASTYTNYGKALKIIVHNIEAERGCLILKNAEIWQVEALAIRDSGDTIIFNNYEIEKAKSDISKHLFAYEVVIDTIENRKLLAIDDALNNSKYSIEEYIKKYLVKSIFCMPLFEQGEIKGLLYLEDNLPDKFNEERINVLDLLSSQIIIIIENIKMLQELELFNRSLEEKVNERTIEVMQQKEVLAKQRDEIEEKNAELSNALELLALTNKDITDSINYAKRIQLSILPNSQFIKQLFPQSFVLYKPKDILSGDFYWFEQISTFNETTQRKTNRIMVAAVDCTGHGVPGALMSIIGNNLINYAVNELNLTDPAHILKAVHEGLIQKLKQNEKSLNQDGMDMTFITYEPENEKILFAGARNSIIIVKDDELIEYKGDNYGIGECFSPKGELHPEFITTTIKLKKGDTIYLFTDGYIDQFSETKRRKFMKPYFKRLLLALQQYNMEEQHQIMDSTIEEWKGKVKQIDDMLIIGLKIE